MTDIIPEDLAIERHFDCECLDKFSVARKPHTAE